MYNAIVHEESIDVDPILYELKTSHQDTPDFSVKDQAISHYSILSFQVNRPMSMKKDGIQTRKRKPKGGKTRGSPKVPPPTTTASSSAGESQYIIKKICTGLKY